MAFLEKFHNAATRKIALATAMVLLAAGGTGAYAATEHWNDASTAGDTGWDNWKAAWSDTVSTDYEQVSLTPGNTINQLNMAWYSHKSETPKVRIALTKSGLKSGTVYEGSQVATLVPFTADVQAEMGEGTYFSNKVNIDNLEENTKYYYQVYQNGKWQSAESYTTGDSTNYSVMYVADPQIGACKGQTSSEAESMADKSDASTTLAARNDAYNWDSILNDVTENNKIDFMISAGDQVNYSNYEYEYAGFLSPKALNSLPVATTIGNHDSATYNYSWHFNNPNSFDINDAGQSSFTDGHTGAGSDYYYTYGDALYIVLDTNNYNCATHENVIKKAVEENKNCKWRIVTFHQDIYGSGKDHSDSDGMVLRTQLTPLMDKYNIDVVLQGHDHTYSRSFQLTGDGKDHEAYNSSNWRDDSEKFASENLCYNLASTDADGNEIVNPKGTVYFEQNSATGSKFYELAAYQQNYIAERSQTWTPTYSIMTVAGDSLSMTTYDANTGKILEGSSTYTITKKDFKNFKNVKISGISSKVSTGKAITQKISVKDGTKTLKEGTDYKVSYKSNTNVGKATVTLTGTGDYQGTITKTFTINPAGVTGVKAVSGSKKATVSWKKASGAKGYKVYMAKSKAGKYSLVKTISGSNTLKTTINKLSKGQNRYFKVRAFAKVNGTTYYGAYSQIKSVKIK